MSRRLAWLTFVLSVAGVALPIVLFFFSRENKALTCETLTTTVVADVKAAGIPGLSLQYGDAAQDRISLFALRIVNSGNVAIDRSDFDGPIWFEPVGSGVILRAEGGQVDPSSLSPVVSRTAKGEAVVQPLLLNPGDRFEVKIVAGGNVQELVPRARVKGISEIGRVNPFVRQPSSRRPLTLLVLGVLGSFLYGSVGGILGRITAGHFLLKLPRQERASRPWIAFLIAI